MKKLLLLLLLPSIISSAKNGEPVADSAILKTHVYQITGSKGYRNFYDTNALNITASYIFNELERATGQTIARQSYTVKGKTYSNIIASFGPADAPRIIIGAHYDVCDNQKGADDNASGIAALLELARLLSLEPTTNWKYRIDLVAYTLEEPPSFRTQNMGSAVHAKALSDNNVNVAGMISIEMIGFYKDARHTQHYPVGFLKWFYGSRGNFITVARKLKGGKFTRRFTHRFKHGGNIVTKVFKAPKWLPGIDFSDHLNYWAYGWDALMIIDTAFYRNANYHEATDTPDTLDYARMSYIVTNLYNAISSMVF